MKNLYLGCIFALNCVLAYAHTDSVKYITKDSTFTFHPVSEDIGPLEEPSDILTEGIILPNDPTDSIRYFISEGRELIDMVRSTSNYIINLDEAAKVKLPVGMNRSIAGINYEIAIHAIRLLPTHAEIDAYLAFEIPSNGQMLIFKARGIKFTKKGGIVGDARLELLGDYPINFTGDKVQLLLKGGKDNSGTYAVMDCDGFKELSIDAEVKFSRDLLRPELPDGSVAKEGNVTSTFKTVMTGWNDLVIQLDLPPFQVTTMPGVGFTARDVVFDFSELRAVPNITFPEGYQSAALLSGIPELWKGFYMREMLVQLPIEFKTKSGERKTFEAYNVIIDDLGVSGTFISRQLIPLNEGNMNGWAFSLDSLNIELQANQLMRAGFNGGLVVPVADARKPFEYAAVINPGGNYFFSISPTESMEFPLWGAGQVNIHEASYLEIRVENKKFLPKANLHGSMNINASLSQGGQGVSLANITFENLELQTVKPYIKVGNFTFGSEALQQKMAGFPISIQNIGLRSLSDTEVGLDFDLLLNLVGENSGSFAAEAGLTLVGNMEAGEGIQSWRYKSVQVRDIMIDIDGGAFKFYGKLQFYRNDNTYGDGFNGVVKAEFKPGIKVDASAIFGSVRSERYWYADAMVKFPNGIQIFSGVAIYGFGGGAYYGMKVDTQNEGSELGETASGVVYVPDNKIGLGLKAVIAIGTYPTPDAFNGDATFEITFYRGGGINTISFNGNGYLVTPALEVSTDKLKAATDKMAGVMEKYNKMASDVSFGQLMGEGNQNTFNEMFGQIGAASGKQGQLSARVSISYDFRNHVLHGNFEMFVNVAGGLIKGVGAGGRAGWAVLHFAPGEWYVYVGTPDDRIGVSLGVGPIRAQATSYFMVGTKIPGSPPPAENVGQILGGIDLDYMRDENALEGGGGFAFGAAFGMDTGDLQFLMFYARFAAGAGFDIMLKNYGDNVRCKGRSEPLGINGWYANGQAYAYFEGEIGIRVKVFGKKRSVEILSIGAAAVLQAKLPNPFWLRGIVGGRFSALGGLVKGKCKFEVTLGEECEMIGGSALEGITVIAEVTPNDGDAEVNVFNAAQSVFNMEVGKVFELVDVDDIKKTFRIKLDHFKIMDGTYSIPGTLEYSDEGDVLAFNPLDILPSKKKLIASAQVSFEEQVNGAWRQVVVDGKVFTEKKETTFTTGEAPDYIPLDNVTYSYPVIGQVNYYKDETNEGYIKLTRGQPDLFNPGKEWIQKGRVKTNDGRSIYFDMAYDGQQRQVNFTLPTAGLVLNTVYGLEILNVPAQEAKDVDVNVQRSTAKVAVADPDVETEVTSNSAEGTINLLQEKAIFTSYFKTSSYSSFPGKVSSLTISRGWSWPIQTAIHELGVNISGPELFDNFEINNSTGFSRLVNLEASTANTWLSSYVLPLIYPGTYPYEGLTIQTRIPGDVNVLGAPPVRAISISQQPANVKLDMNDPYTVTPLNGTGAAVYNLPLISYRDFIELRGKAAASGNTKNPWFVKLIESAYTGILSGNYDFKMKYTLPGTNRVTSEKLVTIVID